MGRSKPYKTVIKIMCQNGWVLHRTSGSHEIYIKNNKICPVKNSKKDIPAGTLSNIERITGLKF